VEIVQLGSITPEVVVYLINVGEYWGSNQK